MRLAIIMALGIAALAAILEVRNKQIEFLKTTSEDLRNRVTKHPALGPIDGFQFILFNAGHGKRHTLQIEEVKADKAFPKFKGSQINRDAAALPGSAERITSTSATWPADWPGVADTVDFAHIKGHYYRSHVTINPTGIVPKGPILDFSAPPRREGLRSAA